MDSNLTHLVVVCCHAIYIGDGIDTAESQWILQRFQCSDSATGKPSDHETFITHIHAGALVVRNDPRALLVFSGGKTTDAARSEAEGYERIFLGLVNKVGGNISHRYVLENLATDSYQNLLFSILRFRQVIGIYPEKVTVITHAFKANRFLDLHAPTIRWPNNCTRVHGIDPPFTSNELEQTQVGERQRGYNLFLADPFGVDVELRAKRRMRNWNADNVERFDDLEEAVRQLVRWDGGLLGTVPFPGELPWDA